MPDRTQSSGQGPGSAGPGTPGQDRGTEGCPGEQGPSLARPTPEEKPEAGGSRAPGSAPLLSSAGSTAEATQSHGVSSNTPATLTRERPRVYRIPAAGPGRRFTSRGRIRLARTLAIAADALQVLVFPFFFEGALSPLADILDVAMAALMVGLLGWHWAFLPTFAAEVVPVLDLFPTWSTAVFFVTRRGAEDEGEDTPPR